MVQLEYRKVGYLVKEELLSISFFPAHLVNILEHLLWKNTALRRYEHGRAGTGLYEIRPVCRDYATRSYTRHLV